MAAGKRDIPDLDIPDLAPPVRPAAPRREDPPRAPASRGTDLDDDFELGSGVATGSAGSSPGGAYGEIALEPGGSGSAGIDFGAGSFDPDFDELQGSTTEAVLAAGRHEDKPRRAWPTGETPSGASMSIDPRDVTTLAAYGPVPSNLALAPAYAARVFLRRRELGRTVATAASELASRERARDEGLGRMIEDLRGEMASPSATKKLLSELDEADARVTRRRSEVAGSNAEYARQMQALDATAAEVAGRIAVAEAVLEQAQRGFEAQITAQQRLEAKEKRLFIELRPLAEASLSKGPVLSAVQQTKVRELEGQIAALKAQLEQARVTTRGAEAAREDARRRLEGVDRERAEVERKRRATNAAFANEIGAQGHELERAVDERRETFAHAGREILRMRGAFPVPEATLDAIGAADRRVNEQALEHARALRALGDYDADGFKQGVVVVIASAIGLVVLLVVLVVF